MKSYREKIGPQMKVSVMTDEEIITLSDTLYKETNLLRRRYKSFQYGYVFSFIVLISGLVYILHSSFILLKTYRITNESILSEIVFSIIIALLGYFLFNYFSDYLSFMHDRLEKEIKHMKKELVLIQETQLDLVTEAIKRNIPHTIKHNFERRLVLIKKSLH